MDPPSLSLVLPCFNEEENIEATLRDAQAWLGAHGARPSLRYEMIVVDDGSTDGTADVLRRFSSSIPSLQIIRHPENRGYASALTTGLDAATMDVIGFMDSDGQFRAADLERLLPRLAEAPFVAGRRRKRADPPLRILIAKVSGILVFLMLGVWVRDINCGMKVFRRELWPRIRPRVATGALFNAELFFRMKRNAVEWLQVPVPHYPRLHGRQTGGSPLVLVRALRELWQLRIGHEKL